MKTDTSFKIISTFILFFIIGGAFMVFISKYTPLNTVFLFIGLMMLLNGTAAFIVYFRDILRAVG
jgi:hypothetical protein